jgi:hypothetical protein
MAYKIMQKGEDGVLREVVIRGEAVRGVDFNPGDMELKQFDDDTRSFSAVGSTGAPDRVEDIVDQKGWELENFEKNPVGMWAHNYTQLPIFRVTDLEIKPRAKKMLFRANFDDFEFADNVYNSYKKKFMRGFSVGFLPLKYEYRDREEMTEEEKQRAGWWGGVYFEKQELLEISAAPIPMHPDALADIKSMGIPTEMGFGSTNLTPIRSVMNDGSVWIPIDDVNLFTDLSSVGLDGGVKAVSGKPIAKADDVVITAVVGYIFPVGMDDDGMVEWLVDNAISEDKACALVTESLDKYFELKIGDDGEFELVHSELLYEEEEDEGKDVDDDIVEKDVDEPKEKFAIIPEEVKIEDGKLFINTSIGSFTIGSDILGKAGLDIREDELVDVRNRESLDIAVNTLISLLKEVEIESNVQEPEPELDAQKDDEGKEDFALLLTVAEELQTEVRETVNIDPEMFKDVVNEVLTESIGGLVKSSLTRSLKYATGDIE